MKKNEGKGFQNNGAKNKIRDVSMHIEKGWEGNPNPKLYYLLNFVRKLNYHIIRGSLGAFVALSAYGNVNLNKEKQFF